MIYLQLFLNFLMIGALSFGGGYGMISLVRETVLRHGWLTEAEFLSFVAVSESTPGPLAINMATFIGSSQGGFPGALIATLGVVLPSFFIILLIAAVLKNLMKYAGVEAFLSGVRPCVVAMILATALNMMLSTLGGIKTLAHGRGQRAVVQQGLQVGLIQFSLGGDHHGQRGLTHLLPVVFGQGRDQRLLACLRGDEEEVPGLGVDRGGAKPQYFLQLLQLLFG